MLTSNCCLGDYLWISGITHVKLALFLTVNIVNIIYRFESLAWIPNAITFVVMLGIGGKHLHPSSFPSYPAPAASAVFSFGAFVGAGNIAWCILAPDYGVHHDSRASR